MISCSAQVVSGQWAGYLGIVEAVGENGTLVVKLLDAGTLPSQILDSEGCGRITWQSD